MVNKDTHRLLRLFESRRNIQLLHSLCENPDNPTFGPAWPFLWKRHEQWRTQLDDDISFGPSRDHRVWLPGKSQLQEEAVKNKQPHPHHFRGTQFHRQLIVGADIWEVFKPDFRYAAGEMELPKTPAAGALVSVANGRPLLPLTPQNSYLRRHVRHRTAAQSREGPFQRKVEAYWSRCAWMK